MFAWYLGDASAAIYGDKPVRELRSCHGGVRVANVEDSAIGVRIVDDERHGAGQILYMAPGAHVATIAIDLERLADCQAPTEIADCALADLARSVDVERANYRDTNPICLAVPQHGVFAGELAD